MLHVCNGTYYSFIIIPHYYIPLQSLSLPHNTPVSTRRAYLSSPPLHLPEKNLPLNNMNPRAILSFPTLT